VNGVHVSMRLVIVWVWTLLTGSALASAEPPNSIHMQFNVRGQTLQVDFVDELNFRIAPSAGLQTLVRHGEVFLYASGATEKPVAMLVADRRMLALSSPQTLPRALRIEPLRQPAATAPAWRLGARADAIFLTRFQREGALRAVNVSSLEERTLARAQASMRDLLSRMDMNVCGSAVRELVAWWVEELTDLGHAVTAVNDVIVMSAIEMRKPASNPSDWLAKQVQFADYRVLPTASVRGGPSLTPPRIAP
jgi:hypothetical protein